MIALLWANQIIAGNKSYADVPRLLKSAVVEILRERGYAHMAE